jgi:hypothetical protein
MPSALLAGWLRPHGARLTVTVESPWRDAGPQDAKEDTQEDDLQDEFLGALGALGGSAGNGCLREVLEWEATTFDAAKAQLPRCLFAAAGEPQLPVPPPPDHVQAPLRWRRGRLVAMNAAITPAEFIDPLLITVLSVVQGRQQVPHV